MVAKTVAIVFGIIFILAGVLGFVPAASWDGKLLGLFMVDTLHSSVHVITGLIALVAAYREDFTLWFFRIFGIVYAILAVVGLAGLGAHYPIIMHMNTADHVLHAVLALALLYFGFVYKFRR